MNQFSIRVDNGMPNEIYNEHNASARGVKMITISRAQRGNSITKPTAQQKVLLII